MKKSGITACFVSLATLLALVASPAHAAPCGGIIPCNCGDTVTTNTTLISTDPVVSHEVGTVCAGPGPALRVAAGVTLNISGLTIRCESNAGSQVGIDIIGDNATVRKGIIKNCGLGVHGATSHSTVLSNRFLNDRIGVNLVGDDNTLQSNVSIGDGVVSDEGFVILGDGNDILSNRCQSHKFEGLFVGGSGNTLERNYCLGNGTEGIIVIGTANTFNRNIGKNNGGHGVFGPGPANTTDGLNYASGNGLTPQCVINGQSSPDGRRC